MNVEEKRKLANEKRLNAVKLWKRNKTVQKCSVGTHVIFDDENTSHIDKKVKLFDSDSEDEKYENDFNVKPQFEGKHGLNKLQMSSNLPDRFKLDERFKDEEKIVEDIDKNEEKSKNFKILESVLGHQVSTSNSSNHVSAEKFSFKKKQVRFDPDDVNASNYLKTSEDNAMKQKKSKKGKVTNDVEEEIPISEERYIEVSSNLKDILSSSAGTFSFTKKFNQQEDLEMNENAYFLASNSVKSSETQSDDVSQKGEMKTIPLVKSSLSNFVSKVKEPFFLKEDDFRLKEGVEFFIRSKPVEKVYEDFQRRRSYVMDLFKKKERFNATILPRENGTFKQEFRSH